MLKDPSSSGLNGRRAFVLFMIIVMVLSVFSVRLFQVQIVQGDEYLKLADEGYKVTVSIAASRGEIVDCNQIPLVSNRTSYAVVLDYNYFPHGKSEEQLKKQNECLISLINLLQENEEEWTDSLPISKEAPFKFEEEEKRKEGIKRLKKQLNMASYATAEQCLKHMAIKYGLTGYDKQMQRILAGIHYEMETAGFSAKVPFTLAHDISSTTMYKVVEKSAQFPGVDITTVPVREYTSGTTACHIIGSVGPIYAEEYAGLKEKGYSYNDILGKEGIEKAEEDNLRGKSGKRVLTKNSKGEVVNEVEEVAPKPGNTVVLSLDSKVQAAAQAALAEKIADLRANAAAEKGKDVKSGSVVVLDVKNGGVITCASWPDYDLSTYRENYTELINDPENPLFNRALTGRYPCGSTFKPGVALAALTDGFITPSQTINCTYTYKYYASTGYAPKCMGYHGHLMVGTALEKSCNCYFYEVGRLMNDRLFDYLKLYGFGQKTGVEIDESSGKQPTSADANWVGGDYLQLAIGQRGEYTPIQLAAYAMMIANGGIRYKTHFVKAIRSYDGKNETAIPAEIAAQVEWSDEAIASVRKGMVAVGKTGTARSSFANAPYTIACKTGTAQTGIKGASDHGTFIGYAPADNPEIAIAVVVENGTSSASASVARTVLDAYFANKDSGEKPTPEGVLIP
ncbi:MAG: hypothetical protein E7527_00620 [Ruminococcaceae bacterium]|nr:hypothetical protein [Oscillospiraceae bacterium]